MNKLYSALCKCILALAFIFGTSLQVFSQATISFTSATGTNSQTTCINNAIVNITYATGGGATGATVTGLPTGVTGAWAADVFAISGTPTVAGTFSYKVKTTGTLTADSALGIIIVNPIPQVNTIANQAVCNNAITAAVNFNSPIISGTTSYSWTNDNPAIGLAANGTGNIASFTAINNSNTAITATVTVTPYSNYSQGFAYIANESLNNVSVINTVSNTIVATVPVGTNPFGVAASLDGTKVYVTNSGSNSLSVINTATNTVVTTIAVGTSPEGVAVSPDGTRVYVANSNSNNVSVINTTTNTVVAVVPVGLSPRGVAVSPDGTKVYISNYVNIAASISVINTLSNTVVATIPVQSFPNGIAVSPDGSKIYVATYDNVSVINTASNTIVAIIYLSYGIYYGIAISPDGSKLYVTQPSSQQLSVISTANNTVIATIFAPSPFGVSVSPDGSKVYTASQSDIITVLNTVSNTYIASILLPDGSDPKSLGKFVWGSISTCTGPTQTFTITVNPSTTAPIATAQSFCNGSSHTVGNLIPAPSSIIKWYNVSTGGTALSTNTILETGTYYVDSVNTNGNGCQGGNRTAVPVTIIKPRVNNIPTQVLCSNTASATISFSTSTTGGTTTYAWTNNNTAIGLSASGTGDIASFTGINATAEPISATITVTPTFTNGSLTCTGTSTSFKILVYPIAQVNNIADQVVCKNEITAVNFSSPNTGGNTIYNWVNSDPSINLAASGTGNIANFITTNSANAPIIATITVTPTFSKAYAYIANAGSYSISVINTTTNTVVANIPTAAYPTGIAISPDGTKVYVTHQNSNTVSVINTASNTVVATVTVGPNPLGVAVNPDGTRVYVCNYDYDGSVSVINTTTNIVEATIPVGRNPRGVIVNSDGTKVYVTNFGSNTISVINTTTNTVVANIPTAAYPIGIAISPDGTRVYISNYKNIGLLSVINTTTNIVAATIPVGSYPEGGVSVTPDGIKVYVTNTGSNTLSVINTATNTVEATIAVGTSPKGVSVSLDGTKVYVTNSNSHNVSVLNAVSNTVVNTIPVGYYPSSFGTFVWGSFSTCTGPSKTFTITLNPPPTSPIAAPVQTFCNGNTVALLSPAPSANIKWYNSASGGIALTASTKLETGTYYVDSVNTNGCESGYRTAVAVTLLKPQVNAIANLFICNNEATLPINFSTSNTGGTTTYSWTNTNTSFGLGASGTGNIASFTAINTSLAPTFARITVTPTLTNGSLSCTDTSNTFTITINPLTQVNNIANQVLCNNTSTTAVSFSTPTLIGTTTYTWTNSNPSIGLAASGTGNIGSFTATNNTNAAVTATVTVTPTYSNGYAYIANYVSNNVSIINTATNTVVATLPVGSNPFGVALAPDGTKVYVTNSGSNTVSVISTSSNTVVATVAVGAYPKGVTVSPDGTKVYVANLGSNTISVINTANNIVQNTIAVGAPDGIAISPDGTKLYVCNYAYTGSLSVINTASNTIVAFLNIGQYPAGIAVTPDGTKVYVANRGSNTISVINTTSNIVQTTLPVDSPRGIAISPDGTKVYVTASFYVQIINTTSNTLANYIYPVGNFPSGVSVSSDGTKIYVVNNNSSNVSVINTATNLEVNRIPVGSYPDCFGTFVFGSSKICTGPSKTFTITVNGVNVASTAPTAAALQSFCSGSSQTVANLMPAPSTNIKWYNVASGGTALTATDAITAGIYYVDSVNSNGCGSPRTAVTVDFLRKAPSISYAGVQNNYCINNVISNLNAANTGGTATAIYIASPVITSLGSGFSAPQGLTVDAAGNVFVADASNNAVKKIATDGTTVTVLGSGFSSPQGVAVDAAGNVYVADANNNAVKKIATDGTTVTVLGSGFTNPKGIAVDAAGNVYVADYGNNAVKKISSDGTTVTVLGSGFSAPAGLAIDAIGNIYVADYGNNAVKKIAPDGITVTTLGSGFNHPRGIAVDAVGNVFVADYDNMDVKRIAPNGTTVTVLGSGFTAPTGVAVDAVGNVYVTDETNSVVKKMSFPFYSISPVLPAGLVFNTTTGAISGTPTAVTSNTTYTISSSNSCGASSPTISFSTSSAGGISAVNRLQTMSVTGITNFESSCSDLIATVLPNAASPISGSTTAKVWIETTQPAQFVKRHYEITPTANATTATANVTLYFTQAEFNAFNAVNAIKLPTSTSDLVGISNLIIEKRSGVSTGNGLPNTYSGSIININPADAAIVWNAAVSRWEVSFDVTGFSGFFVKTQLSVLPLNLLSFSGTRRNTVNQLTWATDNEINTKEFAVERSNDGNTFSKIATINANGSGANNYNYNDVYKFDGRVFYRLKMIDNDGSFTYSNIIFLTAENKQIITLYPNPSKDYTTLHVSNNLLNTKATLTDISGKILQVITIAQAFTNINLAGYASGLYLIKLENGEVVKLIKNSN